MRAELRKEGTMGAYQIKLYRVYYFSSELWALKLLASYKNIFPQVCLRPSGEMWVGNSCVTRLEAGQCTECLVHFIGTEKQGRRKIH